MERFASAGAWSLAFALMPGAFAFAGEFGDMPGLRDALTSIQIQTIDLRFRAFPTQAPALAGRSPAQYPVRGIDVSHYQDTIDWEAVKGAGIAFAYIKATEGGDFTDSAFARNWREASRAGVLRGAYHFYNLCGKGAAQADHFIRTVPADPGALPPTVDIERSNSCRKMPRIEELRRELAIFLAKIRTAYGKRPILYATLEMYESYLKDWSDPDRLWMTSAAGSPAFPQDQRWLIWQHSDRGRVAGITYVVDLNVFNGTPAELSALAQPETTVASLTP